MEMSGIAVLLGLSLALILAAKIAKMLDMSYKILLRLGIVLCVAAGAPLFFHTFLKSRHDPEALFWLAHGIFLTAAFGLFAAFTSKGEVIPPCVPVKRPGQGRITRTAREVAFFLLMGFAWCLVLRGAVPSLGQMSAWDMVACGLFTAAIIVRGFHILSQGVEICGNGLADWGGSRPMVHPWEHYESFSWIVETNYGVVLRLHARSADVRTTDLLVGSGDRDVVQKILEANLPDRLSGAHGGLDRRILPLSVRAKRTWRRRFAVHMVSFLCWPAVVLLLVYLWRQGTSLVTFSGAGFVSIILTVIVNFASSGSIEICKKGLLLGNKVRPWEQYECFFWKGETGDGVELRLPSKPWATTQSMTRLVVAPEDRATAQHLLEVNLPDRSTASEEYAKWSLF